MEDESSRQQDDPRQNGDGEEVSGGPLLEDKDKISSSHTDPEEQERDRIDNRDALQENDRTEVNQTENDEKVTSDEHQPSDYNQIQEPEKEEMVEMKQNEEPLGTEENSEEK